MQQATVDKAEVLKALGWVEIAGHWFRIDLDKEYTLEQACKYEGIK